MKNGFRIYLLIFLILIIVPTCYVAVDAFILNTEEKYKIAIVSDMAGAYDPFNYGILLGFYELKNEPDIEAVVSYTQADGTFEDSFAMLAKRGDIDMIIGTGYDLESALIDSALKNPNINYLSVDRNTNPNNIPQNLGNILFRSYEACFIAGYVAGYTTKANKIGFIGGIKSPVIDHFYYGFKSGIVMAGTERGGKNIELLCEYVGSYADLEGGRKIAERMYDEGADIVFAAAGASGMGAIEVAKERGEYIIGVDDDQNYLAPENVIFSVVKDLKGAVYNTVMKCKDEGANYGGQDISLGLAENSVDVVSYLDVVPKSIVPQYTDFLKSQIISGAINVPYDEESYQKWYEEFVSTL